jgi:DNA-binding transcriptional LysR family regulator
MALSLELLATLQAVVRTGSFSRAAQQLYLTQPAVSLRIRQLEQAVGSAILSRGRREGDLRLTAGGECALRLADDMSALLERFLREIESAKEHHGTLTIACGPAGEYLLLDILSEYHNRFPGVRVRMPLTHGRVNNAVLAGEADMGLQAEDFVTSGLAITPFSQSPMLLVGQPGESIPAERSAQVRWLRTQPFVTSPHDCSRTHASCPGLCFLRPATR